MSIFRRDDYVIRTRKPKIDKQSKIPKPPADYNGSKSYNIDVKRGDALKNAKKASELEK